MFCVVCYIRTKELLERRREAALVHNGVEGGELHRVLYRGVGDKTLERGCGGAERREGLKLRADDEALLLGGDRVESGGVAPTNPVQLERRALRKRARGHRGQTLRGNGNEGRIRGIRYMLAPLCSSGTSLYSSGGGDTVCAAQAAQDRGMGAGPHGGGRRQGDVCARVRGEGGRGLTRLRPTAIRRINIFALCRGPVSQGLSRSPGNFRRQTFFRKNK